jgi:FtsZ-binding cell division protein ZapB
MYMDQLEAALEDVDEIGVEMLERLSEMGGQADSSELRDAMGGIDPDKFNYRRRKYLVPYGLIETEQPAGETAGPMPAQILTLTDLGREFLDAVADREPASIEGRIENIESEIERLQRENEQLREENQELRRAVEEGGGGGGIGPELQSLQAEVNSLQDRVRSVETHPIVASDTSAAVIDTGLILGNSCKRLLEDVLDEETVEETRLDVKSSFKEEDKLLSE